MEIKKINRRKKITLILWKKEISSNSMIRNVKRLVRRICMLKLVLKASNLTSSANFWSFVAFVILSSEKISLKCPMHWASVPVKRKTDVKMLILVLNLKLNKEIVISLRWLSPAQYNFWFVIQCQLDLKKCKVFRRSWFFLSIECEMEDCISCLAVAY